MIQLLLFLVSHLFPLSCLPLTCLHILAASTVSLFALIHPILHNFAFSLHILCLPLHLCSLFIYFFSLPPSSVPSSPPLLPFPSVSCCHCGKESHQSQPASLYWLLCSSLIFFPPPPPHLLPHNLYRLTSLRINMMHYGRQTAV